jgi:outer membrane protein assembly factor BamA
MRYPGSVPVGVAFLLLLFTGVARAQDQPEIEETSPERVSATAHMLDVGDLWHLVRHKDLTQDVAPPPGSHERRFLVITPSIGSKPSTGFNAGVSGNVAFYEGDQQTTHISTISGGAKLSQKGQTTAGVRLGMFTSDDRWFLQSDNRLQLTSLNTYALGSDVPETDGTNLKYNFYQLYETAYRRVRPGLFVGGGLNVRVHTDVRSGTGANSNIDESAYLAYTQQHGFDAYGQTSSGLSVGMLFDTRDNAINADKGWFANGVYRTFFDGFLGGDSTYQYLSLDVRNYRQLTAGGRNKLAFWFMGNFVTGGVAPFFDLPEIGSDGRSGRGYAEGRYRGEHLLYGEVEYRATLTPNGLFGFVAFLNGTTVDNSQTGEKLFDSGAPGAGFGFRVLLNKRSRTNLCTDYGWGKDGSRGFYLSIQEAF